MNQPHSTSVADAADLVSVVIPAYNCEETIELAIRSILDQTYQNIEIIVVNDSSTDRTGEVARRMAAADPRVRVFEAESTPAEQAARFDSRLKRNVNAGYSARTTALKHVRGAYITFQDADDASLLNRIEIQLGLLKRYNAMHITTDWIQLEERFVGKRLDVERFMAERAPKVMGPAELYQLSQKTKGIAFSLIGDLHRKIPFRLKRMRIINKLFFGSITNYPGVTGIPLFRREALEKARFRRLAERVWPSFMGRGADRDFSFQVAEMYQNSYVIYIPLYLWRVKNQNARYQDGSVGKFIS